MPPPNKWAITDAFFALTNGFMGRTTALLVSEVASCQLGGGNIKYWYYKTGAESQLEICTRQPPGSKDILALKWENSIVPTQGWEQNPSFPHFRCYDGLSPSYAQQWIFRVIELPPISQPFEVSELKDEFGCWFHSKTGLIQLIFRATFYPPMDVIALTDITYSSALCGK